jgi:hypothetical protein
VDKGFHAMGMAVAIPQWMKDEEVELQAEADAKAAAEAQAAAGTPSAG